MKKRGYLLRISCRSYTATTVMVLLSIVVAVFCMTVIAGYAETYYRGWASANEYTTIAIAEMDEDTKRVDMLETLGRYGATTALYICRSKDGAVLVGFTGTDQANNWWPDMAGDFVNNYEGEGFPNVVYCSYQEANNIQIGELLSIDGKDYKLIGYGWIELVNFSLAISRSSPQTIFDNSYYNSDDEADIVARTVRVIPYEAFRESYKPDLVLVHFPSLNYGQMLRMTDRVGKMFPNSTVTPPRANASEAFQRALQIMQHFIPIFLILTEITVVLAVCELYRKLREECYICRICGMSRRQLRWNMIGLVGALYLVGTGLALLLQRLLKGFLTKLDVGEMPTAWEVAVPVVVLYLITIIISLPEMNRELRLERTGEE